MFSGNGEGISRRQQSIEIELLKIDSKLTFKEGDSCKYENDYLSPRGWGGEGGGGVILGNYVVVTRNGGGRGVSHRQQSIKIEM